MIVPVLVLALGFSMPTAVGTSLLVISLNSFAALIPRLGHDSLNWSLVLPLAGAAMVGALVGKQATRCISDAALTRVFAAILIAVAVYVGARSISLLPH